MGTLQLGAADVFGAFVAVVALVNDGPNALAILTLENAGVRVIGPTNDDLASAFTLATTVSLGAHRSLSA